MSEDKETPPIMEQRVPRVEVMPEIAIQEEVIVRAAQSEIIEVAIHVDL